MIWNYECGDCESSPCVCERDDDSFISSRNINRNNNTDKRFLEIRNMSNPRKYYDALNNKLRENGLSNSWYEIKESNIYNIDCITDEIYYIELYLKEKGIKCF